MVLHRFKPAHVNKSESTLWRRLLISYTRDCGGAIVNAHDFPRGNGVYAPQIHGRCVADANDPIARSGRNRVLQLRNHFARRSHKAMPRRNNAWNPRHPCGNCCVDRRRRVVKMHYVGFRFFENSKETPRRVQQMVTHFRLDPIVLFLQLLAEYAKSRDCVNARTVSIIPLKAAHLRHQHFGASHLHAVDHVCNLHHACFSLRRRVSLYHCFQDWLKKALLPP